MGIIWFAGTGNFGSRCLELLNKDLDIDLVITSPPAKAGRKYRLTPSAVETMACSLGFKVHRSSSFSEDTFLHDRLVENSPDEIIVVDFGQMIREPFLSSPGGGCLNIHPSLLPEYRGAAPVQRALMEGRKRTGVTVFRLDEGMDSGPIAGAEEMEISDRDTAGTLTEKLAVSGCELMVSIIRKLEKGIFKAESQPEEGASYARKISKDEAMFSWREKTSVEIHNLVRALDPFPGAFTFIRGKRLKIWGTVPRSDPGKPGIIMDMVEGYPVVGALSGSILLEVVQPEGKKRQFGKDWANGLHFKKGDDLNE